MHLTGRSHVPSHWYTHRLLYRLLLELKLVHIWRNVHVLHLALKLLVLGGQLLLLWDHAHVNILLMSGCDLLLLLLQHFDLLSKRKLLHCDLLARLCLALIEHEAFRMHEYQAAS